MSKNIQTLKGFRDFLPREKRVRDYVAGKIREVFETYGFEPLATPTLEYAELLLGKYGEEADRLVYSFEDRGGRQIALRYDQTVPMARVIAEHFRDSENFLNNPDEFFAITRRYQMQNVFRAEKPQKGRYREFLQCDADIFASKSAIADAEILAVFYAIFKNLGIPEVKIMVNDRSQLISYVTDTFSLSPEVAMEILRYLDKLDKKSESEVSNEIAEKTSLSQEDARNMISELTKEGRQPSQELQTIINKAIALGVPRGALVYNAVLARGLDYYTGLIFEAVYPETSGSLGGGGRYDNLIEKLGGVSVPAVGFGLGFDRVVELLEERKLLPESVAESIAQILVTVTNDNPDAMLAVALELRSKKIAVEVYTDETTPVDKQIKYADKKGIPFVVVFEDNSLQLKSLKTGEQTKLDINNLQL